MQDFHVFLAASGFQGFLIFAAVIVAIIGFAVVGKFFGIWVRAWTSGARVTFRQLIGMWLRRVRATVIVDAKITAIKAGIDVMTDTLEAHYLAKGNVPQVVRALVAANKANIDLSFERACAIDLAGRDVLAAVQMSVSPKVIDCPAPESGKTTIDAVSKDGIQVKAKARVTVRANIDRLVGGATEETIIARVGEGIVTTIGSSGTHKDVLENPDNISKNVLSKGLDSGTAFEAVCS